MVTASTLQKHPSFAQLNDEQIECLVNVSRLLTARSGDIIFRKGDELDHFYLVVEGDFEIIIETPKLEVEYDYHGQPSQLKKEYVVLSVVKPGEITGWSALVPPYVATGGCRAKHDSRLVAFDCQKLFQYFEKDCQFGFFMIQTAAQVIGKRLGDIYKGK
jgi:CRP-like cAMP-binding protein